MTAENSDRSSVIIWIWLLVLLGAGMAVFKLPISRIPALVLIFGIATLKAALVLRNYMHLKSEQVLIYAIAFVPVLLAIGMALVLIPDIVFRR
ncbi:MAG: cytochrome C oxidase subunit IV family protein [Candidatus Binatus sp.]|nr:cytochrome C oxidase subunit IV family protein [Candidatus Binatus sp.]